MKPRYHTKRLNLRPLEISDRGFIRKLVNSAGWLKFIGERNIHSDEDSEKYIQTILADTATEYWVVVWGQTGPSIGVITFIQRSYLDHPDIGFAFLGKFGKNGYAEEAANVVLKDAMTNGAYDKLFATTTSDNRNSVRLLEKLGLTFEKEIEVGDDQLLLYSIMA